MHDDYKKRFHCLFFFLKSEDCVIDGGLNSKRVKADLHGTTLSHSTSFQQAYDINCFL